MPRPAWKVVVPGIILLSEEANVFRQDFGEHLARAFFNVMSKVCRTSWVKVYSDLLSRFLPAEVPPGFQWPREERSWLWLSLLSIYHALARRIGSNKPLVIPIDAWILLLSSKDGRMRTACTAFVLKSGGFLSPARAHSELLMRTHN